MLNKILFTLTFFCLYTFAQAQNQLTVCEGEQIYLTINRPAGAAVQWQSSVDGLTYSDVPFGTLDTMPVGAAQSDVFYRAMISGPQCDPYYSEFNEVSVVMMPSAAVAGPDSTTTGTALVLYATAPVVGSGSWSILSGSNGNFINASNPQTTFTGTTDSTYVLVWTVSNPPCMSNTDTMVVKFEDSGLPTIVCNGVALYIHPTDNAGPTAWGCVGTVAGASSDSDGQGNTALIVANCSGASAAAVCDNLVAFGHSDWYLPSYDELECMRNEATLIGGFQSGAYWSSTEGSGFLSANAKYRTFPSGVSGVGSKNNTNRIRCVRK